MFWSSIEICLDLSKNRPQGKSWLCDELFLVPLILLIKIIHLNDFDTRVVLNIEELHLG